MLKFVSTFAILFLTAVLVGCGGGNTADKMLQDLNDSNVKRLANLYHFFQMNNDWKGPKDEAEFKSFIEQMDEGRLTKVGIDVANLDSLFLSERDDEAFKIRYGMNTRVRGPSLPVIFETSGVDGKRLVGFTGGAPQEVDETEYQRLWESEFDKSEQTDMGRG